MRLIAAVLLASMFASQVQARDNTATIWLIADAHGRTIASRNAHMVTPIASITKLVTAMVILDSGVDLDESVMISRDVDSYLPAEVGMMTRRQMLGAALVSSDNMSAYNLCESYPRGYDACIVAMNDKAKALGMSDTRFHDSHGLDNRNVSTANDLVALVAAAATYPLIRQLASRGEIKYLLDDRIITLRNTNPLTRKDSGVLLSKTGYTRKAGACIVMLIKTTHGPRIVVFLHGSSTRTRATEAKNLAFR